MTKVEYYDMSTYWLFYDCKVEYYDMSTYWLFYD